MIKEQAMTDQPPRYSRKFPDRLMLVFHAACDDGDYESARSLLEIVERVINRKPFVGGQRRKNLDAFVAGCERLWMLQHGEAA